MSRDNVCKLHLAFDDIDSPYGGCTTHAATHLLGLLQHRLNIELLDYPHLVRLNPSIPWKTRGNGAIALHIFLDCKEIEQAIHIAEDFLLKYLKHFKGAKQDAGLIAVSGSIPELFSSIYKRALTDILEMSIIMEHVNKIRNVYVSEHLCGKGLVGAVAALGWYYNMTDYTFELLTYRSISRLENPERCIDIRSVIDFDAKYSKHTFNNIDTESHRILITSHGLDPVLYGIRGDDPSILRLALHEIRVCEPIAAWAIFRTNQATDAHIMERKVADIRAFQTARVRGIVISNPSQIAGGHILVKLADTTGQITVAFFKPSGLTYVASQLNIGDLVEVQGSVKPWREELVLHAEKIRILNLSINQRPTPYCPRCGNKMKKIGKGKGFMCLACGYRTTIITQTKTIIRALNHAIYIPPPRAQKHLVKPLQRYGKLKPYKSDFTKSEPTFEIYEPLHFL